MIFTVLEPYIDLPISAAMLSAVRLTTLRLTEPAMGWPGAQPLAKIV
jgi:hypothetical protein